MLPIQGYAIDDGGHVTHVIVKKEGKYLYDTYTGKDLPFVSGNGMIQECYGQLVLPCKFLGSEVYTRCLVKWDLERYTGVLLRVLKKGKTLEITSIQTGKGTMLEECEAMLDKFDPHMFCAASYSGKHRVDLLLSHMHGLKVNLSSDIDDMYMELSPPYVPTRYVKMSRPTADNVAIAVHLMHYMPDDEIVTALAKLPDNKMFLDFVGRDACTTLIAREGLYVINMPKYQLCQLLKVYTKKGIGSYITCEPDVYKKYMCSVSSILSYQKAFYGLECYAKQRKVSSERWSDEISILKSKFDTEDIEYIDKHIWAAV